MRIPASTSHAARFVVALTSMLLAGGCEEPPQDDFESIAVHPPRGETDLPVLEAPLSAEETRALREGFDWSTTDALPETDEDGNPALYYALVFVDTAAAYELLTLSGIYFDPMPLFPSELARWDGKQGYLEFEGDGEGVFVFAFLPGAVFNRMRELAIEGRPLISAVVRREVPAPAAVLPSGALSYEWLVARGFTGVGPNDAVGSSEDVGSGGEPLAGEKLRILRRVVNFYRGIVNTVRHAIAAVRVALGRDRTIRFRLRPYVTADEFFAPGTDPDRDFDDFRRDDANLLVRGWGAEEQRGRMLAPTGARVIYADNLGMASEPLDASGFVRMTVPESIREDNEVRIFLRLRNDAAIFAHGPIEDRILLFQDAPGSGDRDLSFELDTFSARLQMLTQMTDARHYARTVLDFDPSYAMVLDTEGTSEFLEASATTCLSRVSRAFVDPVDAVSVVTSSRHSWDVFLRAHAAPVFGPLDIVMVTGRTSRETPTHEYGHWIWCEMISDARAAGFITIGPQALRLVPDATLDRSGNLTAEAFADLLASQIAGGVDYFNFDRNAAIQSLAGGDFCNGQLISASAAPCAEDNIGGRQGMFPEGQFALTPVVTNGAKTSAEADALLQIATTMTTMHDFFDGHVDRAGDTPGNGASWWRWVNSDGIASLVGWLGLPPDRAGLALSDPHFNDESIALRGSDLYTAYAEFVDNREPLTQRNVLSSLARVAIARGNDATEVCRLLANHTPDFDCAALVGPLAELDDIRRAPPEDLTVTVAQSAPTDTPTWSGGWFDPSFVRAESYTVTIDDIDAGDRLATERFDWVRDLRATPVSGATPLPFDHDLLFTVHADASTSPSGRDPATSLAVTSPAEPVADVSVSSSGGGGLVSWSAVQATEYELHLTIPTTGATRIVGRTSGTSFTLTGLTGNIEHVIRVVAINRAGVPTAHPSAPVSFVPTEPVVGYVSRTFGDDASPLRGSAVIPYATTSLALAELGARGFDVLRFEATTYDEGTSSTITTPSVTLEGGYSWNGSEWIRGGGATTIRFPMSADAGAAYSTTRFLTGQSRAVRAGLLVTNGASVVLDGVTITGASAASGSTDCGAGIALVDGHVRLVDAVVQTSSAAANACRFGLHARGTSSVVTHGSSTITGFVGGTSMPAGLSVAGVAAFGPVALAMSGSTTTGVSTTSSAMFSGSSILGLGIRDAPTVVLSRITVRALDAPRSTTIAGGAVHGIDIVSANGVRIDNSAVLTPRSGSVAIHVEGGATPAAALGTLGLYYVTAASGDDWMRGPLWLSFAKALELDGHIRSMTVKNSLFVLGEHRGEGTIDVSALNPTNVSGASMTFLGNALGIDQREEFAICGQDGPAVIDVEFWVHRRTSTCIEGGTYPWSGADEAGLAPALTFGVTNVSGNWLLSGAVGGGPESERRAPFLAPNGRVLSVNSAGTLLGTPTGTITLLDDGGAAPNGNPPNVDRDRDGNSRSANGERDIGAFIF